MCFVFGSVLRVLQTWLSGLAALYDGNFNFWHLLRLMCFACLCVCNPLIQKWKFCGFLFWRRWRFGVRSTYVCTFEWQDSIRFLSVWRLAIVFIFLWAVDVLWRPSLVFDHVIFAVSLSLLDSNYDVLPLLYIPDSVCQIDFIQVIACALMVSHFNFQFPDFKLTTSKYSSNVNSQQLSFVHHNTIVIHRYVYC